MDGALSPTTAVHSRSSSRSPSTRRQETDDSFKAGRRWARDEIKDPWEPCFLTLDGGGIRGYSSLLILEKLMKQIYYWENVLDNEERSWLEEHTAQVENHPTESDANEERRGRFPNVSDDQIVAEGAEGEHGMTIPVAQTIVVEPTIDHMQQDNATAKLGKRKAIVEAELLPCHYFDFMFGTSTGGLIATLLGRLRMTVPEALELYRKVGDDLFGKRRSHVPFMTKYHHEPLEKAVRDIVGSRCHEHPNCDGNDLHPWNAEDIDPLDPEPFDVDQPRVCQSCCLTATHDEHICEAYLLRTYSHYYSDDAPNWITRYNEGADKLPIWKCARATTAAPFYFDLVTAVIDGIEKSFKDGGIRENNPSGAALNEFHSLYNGKADNPALLLSIGTGKPDQSRDGFAAKMSSPWARLSFVMNFLEKQAVIQNVLIKYTDGEKQHSAMLEHARGEHTWYKRLNVSTGLESMPLDAWVKGDWNGRSNVPGGASLTHMENVTKTYLEREFDPLFDSYAPPSVMLDQAAKKLVRQRRAREKLGGDRWNAFVGKHLNKQQGNGHAG